MADSSPEFPTTIGPDASFKGHLEFEKGARLLGKFEGEISTKGHVLIAEGAHVSGEVQAGNIRIDGEVKGNLSAATKVQLSASGRLEGDIHATRLEVAEGAILVGQCQVGPNGYDGKPQADGKLSTAAGTNEPPKAKATPPLAETAKK